MAIKWQQIKGSFSAQRVLRRLHRSQPESSLTEWKLPPPLVRALAPCRHHGFQWQNNPQIKGLLLYFEAMHRALLLRFERYDEHELADYLHVLQSMHWAASDTAIPWAVFDIQASLPAEAALQHHEFYPGKFTITFTLAGRRLVLLRFKPAAALLNGTSLTEFGRRIVDQALPVAASAASTVRLSYRAKGWQRLLSTLQKKAACIDLYLTHHQQENMILGVLIEGKKPLPPEQTAAITAQYQPFSTATGNT